MGTLWALARLGWALGRALRDLVGELGPVLGLLLCTVLVTGTEVIGGGLNSRLIQLDEFQEKNCADGGGWFCPASALRLLQSASVEGSFFGIHLRLALLTDLMHLSCENFVGVEELTVGNCSRKWKNSSCSEAEWTCLNGDQISTDTTTTRTTFTTTATGPSITSPPAPMQAGQNPMVVVFAVICIIALAVVAAVLIYKVHKQRQAAKLHRQMMGRLRYVRAPHTAPVIRQAAAAGGGPPVIQINAPVVNHYAGGSRPKRLGGGKQLKLGKVKGLPQGGYSPGIKKKKYPNSAGASTSAASGETPRLMSVPLSATSNPPPLFKRDAKTGKLKKVHFE